MIRLTKEFCEIANAATQELAKAVGLANVGHCITMVNNGECSYSFSPIVSTKEDGEIMRLEAEDEYKKAALAAIDAALDYLEQKKRK